MPKRKLKGTVAANKMEKTIIVTVDKFKEHPKYKKRYKSTRRYKVNVKDSRTFNLGEKVIIEETKPQSKEKGWRVIEKIMSQPKTEVAAKAADKAADKEEEREADKGEDVKETKQVENK